MQINEMFKLPLHRQIGMSDFITSQIWAKLYYCITNHVTAVNILHVIT